MSISAKFSNDVEISGNLIIGSSATNVEDKLAILDASIVELESNGGGGGGGGAFTISGSDAYYDSGNVGIGTSSPAYTLDVSGTANVSGNFTTGTSTTATGTNAVAMGNGTIASGNNSVAMGLFAKASQAKSISLGNSTTASGESSIAMGRSTLAEGDNSVAMGRDGVASGLTSVALGGNNTASATNSFAMGYGTTASGSRSVAFGESTIASAELSFAMGYETNASGNKSVAFGESTTASAELSFAMGYGTEAAGTNSLAIGKYNDPGENYVFTVGNGEDSDNRNNALTLDYDGNLSIDGNMNIGAVTNGGEVNGGGSNNNYGNTEIEATPLVVGSSNTDSDGNSFGFYREAKIDEDGFGNIANSTLTGISFSAFFMGSIVTPESLYIYSDKRIKKNINSIEDDKALVDFRKLNPCYYEYIDIFKRGNMTKYGFIAQEVNEVLPYSCSIGVNHIPNIFTHADVSGNLLIVENGAFKNLELDLKDSSGNVFEHVQIALETVKGGIKRFIVNEIIDNNTIDLSFDLLTSDISSELCIYDEDSGKHKVFVYGQLVNNFHRLDKNAIWTLAAAALQEVDRQQQSDKERISELETEVSTLKTQMADLLARVSSLENSGNTTTTTDGS